MKKIFFISSILFLSAGLITAQTAETKTPQVLKPAQLQQLPAARAKAKVAEIAKICVLQEAQTTKLTDLYVNYFTKSDGLKAKQGTSSIDAYAKELKALKGERDAALKSALTAEQIAKLQAAKSEMDKDGAAKPKQ